MARALAQTLVRELSLNEKVLRHSALTRSLLGESGGSNEARGSNHAGIDSSIELFASVAWSAITEPGDEFAGYVRKKIGVAKSLSLLINCDDPRQWAFKLLDDDLANVADERFVSLEQTIQESLARWRPRLSLAKVVSLLEVAERLKLVLINSRHSAWPSHLSRLELAEPAMLWLRGSTSALAASARSAALVGSRTASTYGFEATTSLVQGLADTGIAIISGGAFGIDAIAHRAALAVETPTVAVMAGGVDRLYPRTNEILLCAITEHGAVVSEVAPGTSPTKWRFLQRNRIIAALSSATVVVEAGYRSGAINTANHANALNLSVGAVPGSIFSATSAGCHRLISDGKAQVVTSASDVLELIRSNSGEGSFGEIYEALGNSSTKDSGLTTERFEHARISALLPLDLRVYDAIGFGRLTLDEICLSAGLTSSEAMQALGSLTLLGLVSSADARWARA